MLDICLKAGLVWGVKEDGQVRYCYRTREEAEHAAQVFGSYEGANVHEVVYLG